MSRRVTIRLPGSDEEALDTAADADGTQPGHLLAAAWSLVAGNTRLLRQARAQAQQLAAQGEQDRVANIAATAQRRSHRRQAAETSEAGEGRHD